MVKNQINRLVHLISSNLKQKQYCSTTKVEISQTFEKNLVPRSPIKIASCSFILFSFFKSYLKNHYFSNKVKNEICPIYSIGSSVPQGILYFILLFNLYTSDQPTLKYVILKVSVANIGEKPNLNTR